MKTIKDYLEQLQEPYRTQALNNTKEEDLNTIVTNTRKALYFAFTWQTSPEGYDYWNNLHESL